MQKESFNDLIKNSNISDDELILREYKYKYLKLKSLYEEEILLKENLKILNEKNENILKSLQQIKKYYDTIESDLKKTLLSISLANDKEKIIYKKKLNEFAKKRQILEEKFRKSPSVFELENLILENNSLIESCWNITSLYDLTKKQYSEMMESLRNNFKQTICEFCNIVIKHNLLNV